MDWAPYCSLHEVDLEKGLCEWCDKGISLTSSVFHGSNRSQCEWLMKVSSIFNMKLNILVSVCQRWWLQFSKMEAPIIKYGGFKY